MSAFKSAWIHDERDVEGLRVSLYCINCDAPAGVFCLKAKNDKAVMRHWTVSAYCPICAPGGFFPMGQLELQRASEQEMFLGTHMQVRQGAVGQAVPLPRRIARVVRQWFKKRRSA